MSRLPRKNSRPRVLPGLICAVWALLALPVTVFAHRVYLFAWDEDGRVCSRSYYSKTARIADAELVVRDAGGRELLRGRSDRDGHFCFARPNAGELLLSVDAGQGHRGEFRLSAQSSVTAANAESGLNPNPARSATASADHTELRRIVREEMERIALPLLEEKLKTAPRPEWEAEPGLREILGGLGWIAGLAALLVWYRGRRAS